MPTRRLAVLLLALGFAAPSAAATTPRWTIAHAQKALLKMKLVSGKPVSSAHCNGWDRPRLVNGVRVYTQFRCHVTGQPGAANVIIKVATATRYRIVSCQTASAPLTARVCP